MKKPKRKNLGFLNGITLLAVVLMGVGFSLFGNLIFEPASIEPEPLIPFVIAVSCLAVGVIALILGDSFDERCHYCDKRIYNFRKAVLISWTELTEHSKEEHEIKKAMHITCHKVAGTDQFVIPDPEHRGFVI